MQNIHIHFTLVLWCRQAFCKERNAKKVGNITHENINLMLKIWCPQFLSELNSRINENLSTIFYFCIIYKYFIYYDTILSTATKHNKFEMFQYLLKYQSKDFIHSYSFLFSALSPFLPVPSLLSVLLISEVDESPLGPLMN